MGRRYAISGQCANTANTTILGLTSAATIRPIIYDMIIGSDATPADNAAEYNLQRYTAAGTAAGAVTPKAIDPGDPSSLAAAGVGVFSVEPTYTADAIMLMWSQNQRATFRWVAAPGGEIVLPATAANGIGVRAITVTSAVNTNCCIFFEE